MLFELSQKQLDNVVQALDVSLKSGGISNLKPVNELLVVFSSPVDGSYIKKELLDTKDESIEEKK